MTRKDIAMGLEAQVRADLLLEVGTVKESLTIVGEAPLVDTQKTEVGGNISAEQIKTLPVSGRQWINLLDSTIPLAFLFAHHRPTVST